MIRFSLVRAMATKGLSSEVIPIIAAGHQPAADHILDPFEIFGSMVPWFDGHL